MDDQTNAENVVSNDLLADDIEILTIELAITAVALANERVSKKTETRKTIVDATMKSLGKLAGEGLKELAKSNTFHPEILTPLSIVSDIAVEELGKAFAQSIISLSDSKDQKLAELLDRPIKSGFENALIVFKSRATTDLEKKFETPQAREAVFELARAAATQRTKGEILAIRWMQTLLCLKMGANAQAKEYLKLCLPHMLSIREDATEIMTEAKRSADSDEFLLNMYRRDPNSVLLRWPTMNGDGVAPPESAEDYNERNKYGKPAMRSPRSMEGFIEGARAIENKHRRLIRAIDYFSTLSAS